MGTTLPTRALLRLSGEDVRGFLQGLVTQDMAGPFPVWTALLTPQGKALFDFLVWADGDDLLIDCEAPQGEALRRRLSMYRLRRPIAIEPEEALAVHWSLDAATDPSALPDPRFLALGHRWLAPADGPAEGWDAHRLSLGVTEGVEELGSGETLWLECNAAELNGVSFTKGCYVGQENTARMHYRAKVNRRLVVESLDDAPDDRVRVRYPALGLQIAHRRVEELGRAIVPPWLGAALTSPAG